MNNLESEVNRLRTLGKEMLEMIEEYHACQWVEEPFTPDIEELEARLHQNTDLSNHHPDSMTKLDDQTQQAPAEAKGEKRLDFADALRIARGCRNYSGGHHSDGHFDAYQHGLQTVIDALEAAEQDGLTDMQVAAAWRIGRATEQR